MTRISVVIPNWNGLETVPKCLCHLEARRDNTEIIIVDNGSTDGSVEFIMENYPECTLIEFETNRGFAEACNEGVRRAKHDLILLLNNDVFVEKNFLQPLVEHFEMNEDGSLFAVSCKLLFEDSDDLYLGRTAPKMPLGLFGIEFLPDVYNTSKPTLYPSGGASLVSKDKYLALGGLDPRLFYYEDVDIGYRAWKRGWRVVYEPRSVVRHVSAATTSKTMNQLERDTVMAKGRFVFTWKAITDRWFRIKHITGLPFVLLGSLLLCKKYIYRGFIRALQDRRYAIKAREKEFREIKLSDKEVLVLTGGNNGTGIGYGE